LPTPAQDPKLSTRERILEASIALFNEHGEQRVAMYRIASHLNISPGNLTYHFTRKQDIVNELVDRLERELIASIQKYEQPTLAEYVTRKIIGTFHLMWRYRFFFTSLTAMIQSNAELKARYVRLERAVHQANVEEFQQAIDQGHMRPVRHPNNLSLLADNVWATWLNCIGLEQIKNPEAEIAEDAAVYNCAVHHFSIIEPYSSKEFSASVYALLRSELGM
jgi:AcrR family transcriptional regulator